MGLGSGFTAGGWRKAGLGWALRCAAAGGFVVVQNPEDHAALARLGIDQARITLIRGSGVDTAHFAALPEPPDPPVTAALVGRMLRSKGVLDAVAAIRQLRAAGRDIALVLAGAADPDSTDSLDPPTLAGLAAEPGIEWLGHVEDVRTIWRCAAIALLPSTYGEGVPKALLEAAACGRPIVASDMPGCREVVRDGKTGLLVPPRDAAALAAAIARLADDAELRRRLGAAGHALVEREFAEELVARQTLGLYQAALAERGNR
jgi:glycosyltransferase involved in cell wall biosynthesis